VLCGGMAQSAGDSMTVLANPWQASWQLPYLFRGGFEGGCTGVLIGSSSIH
jgi:hypothetical protein